jgi:AI-2 transport protein TqsA
MAGTRWAQALLLLIAVVVGAAALSLAQAVIAPVVFALFVIALVWPLQQALSRPLPELLAMLVTLLATIVVIAGLVWVAVWGFGRVGHWLIGNAGRLQELYLRTAAMLEARDLYVAGMAAGQFDVFWALAWMRQVALQLQAMISFAGITLVFVILGLLEVRLTARKLAALGQGGRITREVAAATAAKLQRYMLVRTLMSVVTGLAVAAFVAAYGMDLPIAWGVIAFALNYIPFIGPLVSSVLPALFAVAQYEALGPGITLLAGIYLIQFLTGSYFEPRIAGAALSVSPFMVLVAVFLFSLLWGIPGAFIGVPILIALATLAQHVPALAPLAVLLGGDAPGHHAQPGDGAHD